MKKTIYVGAIGALAMMTACESKEQHHHDHESHSTHEEHENHEGHEHHHGKHNQSNHFMNQSDFEELVERFEGEGRDDWQQPSKVIQALGDIKGKTIADIGAGTGYFGLKLEAEGANVLSIDVDQRFIDYVEERKTQEGADNLSTRLAEYDDPKIEDEEVDMVFTVNTYHHFDNKVDYLKKCIAGTKSGGKIVIVDFKKKETQHGPPADHRIDGAAIADDLKSAGYTDIQVDAKTLPEQNIIIGIKK